MLGVVRRGASCNLFIVGRSIVQDTQLRRSMSVIGSADSSRISPPPKRARHGTPPAESNGHEHHFEMPPLSLSILGVEPMDEFIREVADFVHHMILNRPDRGGVVEVEAKVGVLRDKASGQRLVFPVLVETSTSHNASKVNLSL